MPSAAAKFLPIFLIIVTPLAFGTVHTLSIILFAFCCLVIFYLRFSNSLPELKTLLKMPFVIAGLLFLLFVLLQFVPLSPALLRFLSPHTHKLYTDYSLIYGAGSWRSLSIYPWLGIFELVKLISYGFIFLAVFSMTGDSPGPEKEYSAASRHNPYYLIGLLAAILSILFHSLYDFNLHITANAFYFTCIFALAAALSMINKDKINYRFVSVMVRAIVWMGFLVGLFGIIQKFGAPGKIYWVLQTETGPFSTYANYDHAAGFLELCAPIAICAFLSSVATSSFFYRRGIVKKILWFSTPEASKALIYLFGSAITVAALFASSSRGGVMSFMLTMFFLMLAFIFRAKKSRKLRIAAVAFIILGIIIVMTVWVGPGDLLERFHLLFNKGFFGLEGPIDIRVVFYKDTLKLIRDFPLFGTGLSTYSSAFSPYRSFALEGRLLRYAHNDYLQLFSEMGIFGGVFLFLFLAYFAKMCRGALNKLKE
jgi:O-antigen ligase